MVNFPSPVGGTPLPPDFVPSILFAILYGLLLPVMVYRMFHRRSRCVLLIGSAIFTIERIVLFSLRASQARNEHRRVLSGLNTYMQITLGLGFIGLANDLVVLLRCLLVNPTYGPDTYFQSPAAASKGVYFTPPNDDTPDKPKVRFWIRRFCDFAQPAFIAATVPGIIANSNYSKALGDQSRANTTATMRFVSSAVALGLTAMLFLAAVWGDIKLPRISKTGVKLICYVCTLLAIVATYRLSVMHHRTVSLTAPSPLNTNGAKAAFYLFHALPEWTVCVVLFGTNIRKTLGTGLAGDWRGHDETEKEKKKREAKEAKKREKARNALVLNEVQSIVP